MTKCKFLSLFFCVLLIASASGSAMAADPVFRKGEKIFYSVKQLGVKVGDAVLEFKGDTYLNTKKYSLIVFTAKGFNFFDEERIYVDPVTFFPQKVMRDLNILRNQENIMEEYSAADGFVRITKTSNGKTSVQNINKSGEIDNIYGFLYRTRLKGEARVGKSWALRLPTVDIKIEALREVQFNAMGKEYRSVLMKSVPSKYSIWLDLSPQKLPLRISGAIGMSNTVMVMTGYEAQPK